VWAVAQGRARAVRVGVEGEGRLPQATATLEALLARAGVRAAVLQ
jgi:hypothetical protein